MACWKCNPLCENCKQKKITCPQCGASSFLRMEKCGRCGLFFTEEMREESHRIWLENHSANADAPSK